MKRGRDGVGDMPTQPAIRDVIVCGHGSMGSIWLDLLRARVRFVVGRDVERVKHVASKYGAHTTGTTSFDEALNDEETAFVVIASPSHTHASMCRAALLKGKHVLCEKPLGNNAEECDELLSLAKSLGLRLQVGFQRRFDPVFQKAKHEVRGGGIELVRSISRDPPSSSQRSPYSIVFESLIHDIDVAFWLSGGKRVVRVESAMSIEGTKSSCAAILRFDNDVLALLVYNQPISYGYDQRAEVFHKAGVVSVENPPLASAFLHSQADRTTTQHGSFNQFYGDRYAQAYAAELEYFFLSSSAPPQQQQQETNSNLAAVHDCARLVLAAASSPPTVSYGGGGGLPSSAVGDVVPQPCREACIALIGCGRMGAIRAAAIQKRSRDLRLVYAVDPRKEARDAVAALVPMCRAVESIGEALKDPTVTGVWICSGTAEHLTLIQASVSAGVKHIYCEKPISLVRSEIAAAYQACSRAGATLSCGWNRLFDDHFSALFHLGPAMNNGSVVSHNGDHPCPPRDTLILLGSIYHDLLVHDFHCAVRVCPSSAFPVKVVAMGTTFDAALREANVIDSAACVVLFSNGTISAHTAQRASPVGYDQRMEMVRKGGDLVRCENPRATTVIRYQGGGGGSTSTLFDRFPHSFPDRYAQAYYAETEQFASTILRGVLPKSSARECDVVAWICDEALKQSH